MELPTHPLLTLVECNANSLKSMLTHYIDATVDRQFASLRNSIETMIQYRQIGPQKVPPTQANTDQSSTLCSHEYSNDTLNRAQEHQDKLQNEVSNTINTDGIKQEFGDNDEGDGEEIDDKNVENCEKCEKGICNSVRENYNYTDMGENGDELLETQQNVNTALENNQMNQSINSNDILSNPTNQINTEPHTNQKCLESLSITIPNSNAVPNNLAYSPNDEFNGNGDDDYYEDSENGHLNQPNCDDCANGVCDLDHLNNEESFETQHIDAALEDNQIYQSIISNVIDERPENGNNEFQVNDESDQLHNIRRSNEQNSNKKKGHLIKRRIRQAARQEPIESPTPSTSGVRSSTRKRIPKKVFGEDQLNDDEKRPKREKRKSVQLKNRSMKKAKQIKIENAHEDINDQREVKGQVVVIELNCTEPGCGQTVTSRSSWREHMRKDHHKLPHHQLKNNARLNDRDQTEHPCIEPTCNVICTTHRSSIKHWNYHHQAGKFKCPSCRFVASLYYKVRNHFNTTHGSHGCTHSDCGEKFPTMSDLKRHEQVHSDERPYKCTWKKCQSSFKQIGTAFQHVRVMHFNLPKSTKEQNELNIIDSRNAHDYIHKD